MTDAHLTILSAAFAFVLSFVAMYFEYPTKRN